MTETWKSVVGREGLYEVSDQGRVRSVDRTVHYKDGRTRRLKGRVLKPWKNRKGYLLAALYGEGKTRTKFVHRIVLEAFVGDRPEGLETLHIDGNPANNHVGNLKWGTSSENALDKVRHGRHHNAIKTHCSRGHELIPGNLRKGDREKGHRSCLACGRAHSHIWHHPEKRDSFQQIADQYYEKIVKGA